MGDNNTKYNDNDPVVFVNAVKKVAQSGKTSYIWSKTFNLDSVKNELGTSFVTIKVLATTNRREEDDRLLVISPSKSQYMPRSEQETPYNSNNTSNSKPNAGSNAKNDKDVVL